eukprot:m.238497 g.238497  ORF g.238497 m.238497 type:complete len:753 (+) comp21820_c0_seq1:56-2314(+)
MRPSRLSKPEYNRAHNTKQTQRMNRRKVQKTSPAPPPAEDDSQEYSGVAKFVSRNVLLSLLAIVVLFSADIFGEYQHLFLSAGLLAGLLAIILTYTVGGRMFFSADWSFFQPLKGGGRFIVFQIIGWTFFAFTIALPWLPWLLAWHFPQEAIKVLIMCAGASALVGEIMMVCSLLTYNRPTRPPPPPTTATTTAGIPEPRTGFKEFLLSRRGYHVWKSFIGLQAILSIFACALAILADKYTTAEMPRLILTFFAVMCFSLSLFLAYGVGGRWKYYSTEWRFYQPFSGGTLFIVLQALAWALFSLSMLVFLFDMHFMLCHVLDIEYLLPFDRSYLPSFFVTSLVGVGAQFFNAASLFFYTPQSAPGDTSALSAPPILASLRQLSVVVILFNLEKICGAVILLSILFAEFLPHVIVSVWLIGALIYLPTFRGHPSRTGRRNVPSLRGYWLFDELANYFRLSIQCMAPLDPAHKYIMGFHPHGILPVTCGWVHFTTLWSAVLPNITPASLTSTVVHYVPVMRDVLQMLAGLEVTKEGFARGLELFGSTIFVPGGQREMLESRSEDRHVVLSTHHRGFVRLAMTLAAKNTEDVYLVPLYSFGETQLLDNLRLPLVLQQWCIRLLRANVVFFPYGMLGLPGVPRPEKLTLAVGKPVLVPRIAHPSNEQVTLLHRRFYTELQNAFDAFKEEAGHGDDQLKLTPEITPLTHEEWERERALVPESTPASHHGRHHHGRESAWVGLTLFIFFAIVLYKAYG